MIYPETQKRLSFFTRNSIISPEKIVASKQGKLKIRRNGIFNTNYVYKFELECGSKENGVEKWGEEGVCRICLASDKESCLVSPCSCDGTQKFVHERCLKKWILTKEGDLSICEICQKKFKMKFEVRVKFTPFRLRTSRAWVFLMFALVFLAALVVSCCVSLKEKVANEYLLVLGMVLGFFFVACCVRCLFFCLSDCFERTIEEWKIGNLCN